MGTVSYHSNKKQQIQRASAFSCFFLPQGPPVRGTLVLILTFQKRNPIREGPWLLALFLPPGKVLQNSPCRWPLQYILPVWDLALSRCLGTGLDVLRSLQSPNGFCPGDLHCILFCEGVLGLWGIPLFFFFFFKFQQMNEVA